jgi:hypothetical protein
VCGGGRKKIHTDFQWKLLRMLPFVKPRRKLQNNYKIGLKEIGCEDWR